MDIEFSAWMEVCVRQSQLRDREEREPSYYLT